MGNRFRMGRFSASDRRVQRIVTAALLAALACAATMVIRVPSPTGGYLNLGDTAVLLGAFLLGPWLGALAGGVGAACFSLFDPFGQWERILDRPRKRYRCSIGA